MRSVQVLNPKTGSVEQLVNAEFYPAYLFLPEAALKNYPSIMNGITRYPGRFLKDQTSRSMVSTDVFLECIIDFYAILAWPYIAEIFGLGRYMEIYSGYDVAWQIAHAAHLWIDTMEIEKIIPEPSDVMLNADPDDYFGFVTLEYINAIMSYIVPLALDRSGLDKVIEVTVENRCIEDFDYRDSNKKTDFIRQWYHTRTKHPQISLEEYQDNYAENNDGEEWDIPDLSVDIELFAPAGAFVDHFMSRLDEKDQQILQLRMRSFTFQEIAAVLGYKNHSGVIKRMQKIEKEFIRFAGKDYNLASYLKPEFRDDYRDV